MPGVGREAGLQEQLHLPQRQPQACSERGFPATGPAYPVCIEQSNTGAWQPYGRLGNSQPFPQQMLPACLDSSVLQTRGAAWAAGTGEAFSVKSSAQIIWL